MSLESSLSVQSEKLRNTYISLEVLVSVHLTRRGLWVCVSDPRGRVYLIQSMILATELMMVRSNIKNKSTGINLRFRINIKVLERTYYYTVDFLVGFARNIFELLNFYLIVFA